MLARMTRRRNSEVEASLGEAQSSHPANEDAMIEADADPLDTDVEDADLFLGDGDDPEPESQ
jgi:hypothetical protein